jgi:hypothetical protein
MDEYDVFISHASEDKDAIARPIAEALSSYGVRVWYDEFTLKLGDSLSRSIDKGLAKSSFGLVILSPSFFAKNWPEYELRGLTAKELRGSKVILPIWHQVDIDEVLSYSPPLADKLAVNTANKSPDEIALEVIKIIRPDILTKIHKRIAFLEALKRAKAGVIKPEDFKSGKFKFGPLKHKELPPPLISRIRLIRAALLGVYPHSMEFWVDGFRGDAHPSKEIMWWEHVASCYLEYIQMVRLESHEQYHAVFDVITGLRNGDKKKDLQKHLKLLPKGSYEKIRNLLKYNYPSYDFKEEFPFGGVDMTEEEHQKWLGSLDIEDFESIDKQE